MKTDPSRVPEAIRGYLNKGWIIDYFAELVNSHIIYSPSGSVFRSPDLEMGFCPFCDEDNPNWKETWCDHSQELLDEEANARNLLELLKLAPQELQARCLP